MNKDEGVAPFFTKIAQVRDQLTAIGITVDDDDLIHTVFDGVMPTITPDGFLSR